MNIIDKGFKPGELQVIVAGDKKGKSILCKTYNYRDITYQVSPELEQDFEEIYNFTFSYAVNLMIDRYLDEDNAETTTLFALEGTINVVDNNAKVVFEEHNLNKDIVLISRKEYESLLEDSNWLSCLESAGVDNWQGIDYAISLKEEMETE
jgi:hypothetical protein